MGVAAEFPQHDRIISDRLAAELAGSMPKYEPASKPTAPPAEADGGRDRDNPGDEINHLPDYVVQGSRAPVFRERDPYNQSGLSELARKRYITQFDCALNLYCIPFFRSAIESRALAMYAEDERLQSMADLDRMAQNAALIDRATSTDLKRLADATYLRSHEPYSVRGLQ
jgi:hypothetical protein